MKNNFIFRISGWKKIFPIAIGMFFFATILAIYETYTPAIAQTNPLQSSEAIKVKSKNYFDNQSLIPASGINASPTITTTIYLPYINYYSFSQGNEWTQEAHDAQRTGYTSEVPQEPWTLLWTWNGPDATGGSGNHFYDAPREARTVTGGGNIYVPAGAEGLYALALNDGHVVWNYRATSFNATPAYDPASGSVFAGGDNGFLYKINVFTGLAQSYQAGNPINRAILLAGNYAYALTDDGHLHKVNTTTLSSSWVYPAGSTASTGLAYSATRDVILFGTNDLYVHAVRNANGTVKWRVKPSSNPAGFPNEYHRYWPVVAEQHGVVFLRMRLDHNTGLWGYPSDGNVWPTTNAEARDFLINNPEMQNLFALSLDDGSLKFIPAVGYGGTEETVDNNAFLDTGPLPVVKVFPNGTEVAYIFFRNGQTTTPPPNPFDGRGDSHLGEMVLDNTTVPGLVAGDLRFVEFINPMVITDEQNPLSMAGNTIFHAHWGASESVAIIDRSNTVGLTYANPITTSKHPTMIRRQVPCEDKDPITHWTGCGLLLFDDGRYWSGPGWWVYWNVMDPPTPIGTGGYADGIRPRYTYVSAGFVITEGNGGELLIFQHP